MKTQDRARHQTQATDLRNGFRGAGTDTLMHELLIVIRSAFLTESRRIKQRDSHADRPVDSTYIEFFRLRRKL
jgi:hypothetical protein